MPWGLWLRGLSLYLSDSAQQIYSGACLPCANGVVASFVSLGNSMADDGQKVQM